MNKLLERLTGRHWYHQRFDAAPLYLSMIGKAEMAVEDRKPAGTEAKWRLCFYSNGSADWYLDEEDIQRGAEIINKLVQTSGTVSEDLMAQWKEDEDAFDAYFHDFRLERLSKLSDEELLAEYKTYRDLAFARSTSSSIIDHFALGTDQQIAALLRKEVSARSEPEFNHIFSVATSPVHQSFINEAEISLLAIAKRVQAGEKVDSANVQQLLKKHQAGYFWIANNYVKVKVLPVEFFEEEIQSWLKTGKDLEEERRTIEDTPKENKKAKGTLVAERKFSENFQRLLRVSENFTNWQDERKKATYFSIHLGSLIVGEMARRREVDPELTKYLLPTNEVEQWFVNGSITADELSKRKTMTAVLLLENQEKAYIGEEVKQIRSAMFGNKTVELSQDVRGLVASTGRAIGTARIVTSAEDIEKVREGDILVAVMTRPDYVPAMKKAAAIVTDEGGITSHAAIVARELRVPCIIATKIASKVFKDGDKLEVNANHNWVRKLS